MLWRHLPLAGVIAVILIAGFVRPMVQFVRHGTFGVFLFRSGRPAQTLRDTLLIALLAGFIAHAITGPRRPRWVRLLVSETSATYEALQIAGAVLIIVGTVLFAAAQLNLGASWRIGVDEGAKSGLVTGGLYRISRHPIFLGFLTVFTGYALMMPTPLSLALLLGAYAGFRTQAGTEEAYMVQTHGEPYRAYARRVGRFLPGVGKL